MPPCLWFIYIHHKLTERKKGKLVVGVFCSEWFDSRAVEERREGEVYSVKIVSN